MHESKRGNEKVPPFIVSQEEKYGKEGYGN
jgi:hypothetical protein